MSELCSFTVNSHTMGVQKTDEPVKRRLQKLFGSTSPPIAGHFELSLTLDGSADDSTIRTANVTDRVLILNVPIINGSGGGYRCIRTVIRPKENAPATKETYARVNAILATGAGNAVFAQAQGESPGHLLARSLRAIHEKHASASQPISAVNAVREETNETRHKSATAKQVADMVAQGNLRQGGKYRTIRMHYLTQKAATLIDRELGMQIDITYPETPKDVPDEPPLYVDDALEQMQGNLGALQERLATLPKLRAEIERDQTSLNEKKEHLKVLEQLEREFLKSQRALAKLLGLHAETTENTPV